MSSFKEYIKRCVADNNDILVEVEHLDSVTYDDICALIYFISGKSKKVELSKEVQKKLGYYGFDQSSEIIISNKKNYEELAILLYLSCDPHHVCYTPVYYIAHGKRLQYKMSTDFIIIAESFALENYRLTRNIIASFEIGFEPDTNEAKACFDMYLEY
jgi:hypothetical protein